MEQLEAEKQLLKYIEIDKDNTSFGRFELGKTYRWTDRDKDAEEQFLICIDIEKDKLRYGRFELGRLYEKIGRYQEAEEQFIIASRVEGDDDLLYFELGKTKSALGKLDEAEDYLKRCIELNGISTAKAMCELAYIYKKQNKEKEALQMYKQAAQLEEQNDNGFQCRLELGRYYIRTGQYKEAEETLQDSVNKADESNTYLKTALGKVYLEMEKYDEAEELFQNCLEIDPENPYARMQLGYLYAIQGKDEESKEMYKFILSSMEYTDDENTNDHIMKHMSDNKTKKTHGVFTIDPIQLRYAMDLDSVERQIVYMADIYCFRYDNCGYEGGYEGDGHILNYVTVVTLPHCKERIITMFPSDEVKLKVRTKLEEKKIELINEKQEAQILDSQINSYEKNQNIQAR